MDCIFCKIATNEIPSLKVYEDNNTIAFLDVNPLVAGHTVVTTKTHVKNILELDDKMIEPLFLTVKKIVGLLKKALNPDDFNYGVNHGPFTNHIPHLHVHIFPRFKNDGGGSMHTIVRKPPTESLDTTFEKIKKASEETKSGEFYSYSEY